MGIKPVEALFKVQIWRVFAVTREHLVIVIRPASLRSLNHAPDRRPFNPGRLPQARPRK